MIADSKYWTNYHKHNRKKTKNLEMYKLNIEEDKRPLKLGG